MTEPLEIISLGAGVQSSVMALMAARGELTPMPVAAIFADTQWEPRGVYDHLSWLEGELPFPVYRVTAGNIRDDVMAGLNTTGQRFAVMPFFTGNGGMGRRQCTAEYKIAPIRLKLREMLGLRPRQRAPKGVQIVQWLGISTDEATRMKPSRDKWVQNRWPLIEQRISRHQCEVWFAKHFPARTLSKSACVGCPFHNDAMWRDMKLHDQVSWLDAVDFDLNLRAGDKGKYKEKNYLHRSLLDLNKVDLRNIEDRGQLNLFENECDGMCGL